MRVAAACLGLLLLTAPAAAQDESKPILEGRVSPAAPPFATTLRDALEKEIRANAEFYADDQGALSVHKGVSTRRLRRVAQWIEKQEGVRQALTDSTRRMILIIFTSAPEALTPQQVAAPLEGLRRSFQESKEARSAPLGGPGDPPPMPEPPRPPHDLPTTPPEPPIAEPPVAEPEEPSVGGVVLDPATAFPSYSYNPETLSREKVEATKVYGEVSGKRALDLWLSQEDRLLAVAIAQRVIKTRKDAEAGAVLGMWHLHLGNQLKAYQNLRTVRDMRPNVGLYHAMYAEVLSSMKRTFQLRAREERERALELGYVPEGGK